MRAINAAERSPAGGDYTDETEVQLKSQLLFLRQKLRYKYAHPDNYEEYADGVLFHEMK